MFSLLLVLAFICIEVFQHALVTRYFRLQIFHVGQQLFDRHWGSYSIIFGSAPQTLCTEGFKKRSTFKIGALLFFALLFWQILKVGQTVTLDMMH